jgi:signal transduction histidine kinase
LREALARTLRDPELQIAYPVDDGQVDAAGEEILGGDVGAGRARTPIVRDGEVVATLDHRADVLDATATIDEVVRAARLGLEHERLEASSRSQLAAITAARKRIVATADDERRRLERDLHDGAQQHLIAIAIRLRLLAGQVEGNERAVAALSAAAQEIGLAIDDLRDVAHGIYPSILADEGLAAALEGLAEGAAVPLVVDGVPPGRLVPAVEAAAYAVVAEALAGSRSSVRVDGRRESDDLVLTVVADVLPDDILVDLSDRIGAADGRFDVRPEPESNRLVLTVVLPCAS